MKTNWIKTLLLITLLLPLPAAADDDTPLPLPPGVQLYQGGGAVQKAEYFANYTYTKDSTDTVTNFYRRTLGSEPIEGRTFYLGHTYTNSPWDGRRSIFLEVRSAADQDNLISESDLFGSLEGQIKMSKMHGAGGAQNDRKLQGLKKKYAHLANKWYPELDERKILSECGKEGNAARSKEGADYKSQNEMDSQRIQELAMQGRGDEAKALAMQSGNRGANLQNQMTSVRETDFKEWERCYRKLEGRDYRTMVIIKRVDGDFNAPSASGREKALRELNKDQGDRAESKKEEAHESSSKSSSVTDQLKDKGMGKLKGMFGF